MKKRLISRIVILLLLVICVSGCNRETLINDKNNDIVKIDEVNIVGQDDIKTSVSLKKGKIKCRKVMKNVNKKFNGYSLVGYSKKYVYWGKFEKNAKYSYYISENKDSHLNKLKKIYTVEANLVYPAFAYGNEIILSNILEGNKEIFTNIYKINAKGGKCIHKSKGNWRNLVCLVGKEIFINQYNKNGSVIYKYSLAEEQIEKIRECEYHTDKNGKATGEAVYEMAGFESGVIIEIVQFNDELPNLDETGRTEIWYYDIKKKGIEKLPINPKRKALYVGGDRNCVIISDYANKEPLEDTGRLYLLKNKKYEEVKIPEIESANDIIEARRLSHELIVIRTSGEKLYLIDLKNYKYEIIDHKKVCFGDDSFCIIDRKNRMYIYSAYSKQLCSYKGVEIIEGHWMPDHIRMLVNIPPR